MELIERLAAIDAIKRLKARYWRLIDTRQGDAYRTLFAPGMSIDFPELGHAMSVEKFIPLLRGPEGCPRPGQCCIRARKARVVPRSGATRPAFMPLQ